ncbi:ATP-dependent DNA helicase Q1 isoform X1 [Oryzias melastigma]|uniref:ATP-dependent DNA helicase Q1 isoform X1 n=1 Tax=Oryzias melastigma TaxID=30732 RepID=UPI000CF7C1D3|nr:ATP-dependent DNA helicase Q1 isoform X1 [Oryzias melastigma]
MDVGSSDVQAELDSVEEELQLLEVQISELLEKQAELTSRKEELLQRLEGACEAAQCSSSSSSSASSKSEPGMSQQEMQRYDEAEFPWSAAVEEHLRTSFHLSAFRPLQLRAINLTMEGRDVFLVMPTGRGKSLCYQLPAVCSEGFTLVVTPLVSLMEDQLLLLRSLQVPAAALNASSGKEHTKTVLAALTDPKAPFKLVYVTPEKIAKSKLLMSRLEKAYKAKLLSRMAVDEVHCCSQWGHDFRPDYKLLGILKRQFPTIPLLGLTATATSSVLQDCRKILCVPKPVTLTASFNRANLYYEVRVKDSDGDSSLSDISSLIKNRYEEQSGIVYVFSQKDAESVSSALQKSGIVAYPYHANMDPEDKSRVHRKWTSNKIQVVVATVAFGMGIDKPDVRFVIHHTISKSIENYYQESGRAGRDDRPADCIVYFGFGDIFRISTMVVMENVGQQKLLQMVDFCQNVDRCRRSLMAVHFDEVWDEEDCNQMCDTCRHPAGYTTLDVSQHARQVVQIVELATSMDERLTPLKLVEAWRGRGPAKRRKMIQTTELPRRQAEAVIVFLLLQGYLREDFSFTPYTTYFYVKLGRKAPLLKNQTHKLTMKMKTSGAERVSDLSAVESREMEEPLPHHKVVKEQMNMSRKQDLQPSRQTDQIPGAFRPPKGAGQTAADTEKPGSHEIKSGSKNKTPSRRKGTHQSPARSSAPTPTRSSCPSQASIISDTAAEELHHLRKFYSQQLRRIDQASLEQLGAPRELGVLSCIRGPLRSLRLPCSTSITQTARSLWTRVSGRRRLQ